MCNEVTISPTLDWKNEIIGYKVEGYSDGWLVANLIAGTEEEAEQVANELLR